MLDTNQLDLNKLSKGSIIPAADIERVTGICRSDNGDAYRLGMLVFKAWLEAYWQRERSVIVTIRAHGDELSILTDAEASAYQSRNFRAKLRGAKRSHRKMMGVATSKLTYQEKEAHEREVEIQGRYIQAMKSARGVVPHIQNVSEQTR